MPMHLSRCRGRTISLGRQRWRRCWAATERTGNTNQKVACFTTTKYPKLFSPLELRWSSSSSILLPSRALMGSMHTSLEGHNIPEWLVPWLTSSSSSKKVDQKLEKMARYFQERAQGGVGLMVTGGISPNRRGLGVPFTAKLTTQDEMMTHKIVTSAVHQVEVPIVGTDASVPSRICMQILHTGRYAYHPFCVSSSNQKARIAPFQPKALSATEVEATIQDFVRCAALAQEAGYDGVEIMGSEGYLISQFLTPRTNPARTDGYGGESLQDRARMALEIVRQMRQATNENFIIIFRLSVLDLVEQGLTFWEETIELAHLLQEAGTSIINSGIGWHEARVPTIATSVPRGAFVFPTAELKKSADLHIPVVATNRINDPAVAESLLANGSCDMVSLARPFLADSDFLLKAREGRPEEINTCIACNQACLDHVFVGKPVSCLVNPRACHETELDMKELPPQDRKNISVVGAGPAGCAFAITAAQIGHGVTLYEESNNIGGQFNMAKRIPGKEEFHETLRYFRVQLQKHGVNIKVGTKVTHEQMLREGNNVDKWVIATGVHPRTLQLSGMNHPKVLSYVDVLMHKAPVGERVAIVGAGGIGFDVAVYLLEHSGFDKTPNDVEPDAFWEHWGIDLQSKHRGGLLPAASKKPVQAQRHLYLLQRKQGKFGASLGKTTGWIHKSTLLRSNVVEMLGGVKYEKVDNDGNLHIANQDGKYLVLEVDNIIICAGQESNDLLDKQSRGATADLGERVYTIGGAWEAGELDAKRAIDMGTRLALRIHDASPGKHVFQQQPEVEEVLTSVMLSWMK